jgi:hypothetical protein
MAGSGCRRRIGRRPDRLRAAALRRRHGLAWRHGTGPITRPGNGTRCPEPGPVRRELLGAGHPCGGHPRSAPQTSGVTATSEDVHPSPQADRLPVHVPAGTCVTGGTPWGPRLERMHTLDSAVGLNLQQTTKERKLPMTPGASSLSGLTARTLGWVAGQASLAGHHLCRSRGELKATMPGPS